MPERVLDLVVRAGNDQRQIGLLQDRRAENLGSAIHALVGQRQYVPLHDIQQAGGYDLGRVIHQAILSRF